jgi:hypothetical protein
MRLDFQQCNSLILVLYTFLFAGIIIEEKCHLAIIYRYEGLKICNNYHVTQYQSVTHDQTWI